MATFSEILSAPSVFANRNVLSPHYVPGLLPFREREIERVMVTVAPALAGERVHNMFIYGKTGTGKTCTARHVMGKFESHARETGEPQACWNYVNCRMYNSRYRVIQKLAKDFMPELDKSGFGISSLYEKYFGYIKEGGLRNVVVLDEVDMVRDLDELIYTLTRMNDELAAGSVSIIGITNKLSFKDELGQRSKSSLCETEIVFAPYTPMQLGAILRQRAEEGFKAGCADESALNLAAAIAANETGDARYALKLLLRAGEIADERKLQKITDSEVELARRSVDADLATEAIVTLPVHQQLVLLSVCNLTNEGGKYRKLGTQGLISPWSGEEAQKKPAQMAEEGEPYLLSGEVYEEYSKLCRQYKRAKRSARWGMDETTTGPPPFLISVMRLWIRSSLMGSP